MGEDVAMMVAFPEGGSGGEGSEGRAWSPSARREARSDRHNRRKWCVWMMDALTVGC
jgi:hypothetical protein